MKKLIAAILLIPILALSQPPHAVVVKSAAKEASKVLKATAGSLVSLTVTSDTDQYILIMDSATLPANGAVTLLVPPIHVSAASTTMITFQTR